MQVDTSRFEAALRRAEEQLGKVRRKRPSLTEAQCERLDREMQRLRGLARKYERSKPGRSRYYHRKADAVEQTLTRSQRYMTRELSKHFQMFIEAYWAAMFSGFARWGEVMSRVGVSLRRFAEKKRLPPVTVVSMTVVSQADVASRLLENAAEPQHSDHSETSHTRGTGSV